MKTLLLLATLISAQAWALKLPINSINESANLPKTFTASYDFEGIVGLSNCSGSLIQLEGMNDNNQALILTNGHCVEDGFPAPGQVKYQRPSSRVFRLLNSASETVARINAVQLVYATMTDTDMAIYKVRETYADIKSQYNIRPYVLDSRRPQLNEAIEVISGYWKRGYSCAIENFIFTLKEDGWTMKDSIRYSRPGCETIGGTSGSPIVRAGTKVVIGVNNTGNEDGRKCTMNNPCEINEKGDVSFVMGYSYGQQTFNVYSCLTTTNEIDLSVPGCVLPK